ncbi:Peptidyl-prolyl cis-trans isomerase [Flavobacterium longum]|uniref:peptidylprolyl isomerase n=1 Tax=Flavobacterium longum TaxID=1299340 RepID=UPI0039EC1BDA
MMRLAAFCIAMLLAACAKPKFNPDWTKETAPETFTAVFETTKGDFEVTVTRSHSPAAADRFYQLVKYGYFDNALFYRVVEDFVVQFGNTDTIQMNQWRSQKIPDEPVLLSNKKGTISFARDGVESRDLELFINLDDNPKLDTLFYNGVRGFPAFGKVTEGMDVVRSLYQGYGEETMAHYEKMYNDRQGFYRDYPKLDIIRKAAIVK